MNTQTSKILLVTLFILAYVGFTLYNTSVAQQTHDIHSLSLSNQCADDLPFHQLENIPISDIQEKLSYVGKIKNHLFPQGKRDVSSDISRFNTHNQLVKQAEDQKKILTTLYSSYQVELGKLEKCSNDLKEEEQNYLKVKELLEQEEDKKRQFELEMSKINSEFHYQEQIKYDAIKKLNGDLQKVDKQLYSFQDKINKLNIDPTSDFEDTLQALTLRQSVLYEQIRIADQQLFKQYKNKEKLEEQLVKDNQEAKILAEKITKQTLFISSLKLTYDLNNDQNLLGQVNEHQNQAFQSLNLSRDHESLSELLKKQKALESKIQSLEGQKISSQEKQIFLETLTTQLQNIISQIEEIQIEMKKHQSFLNIQEIVELINSQEKQQKIMQKDYEELQAKIKVNNAKLGELLQEIVQNQSILKSSKQEIDQTDLKLKNLTDSSVKYKEVKKELENIQVQRKEIESKKQILQDDLDKFKGEFQDKKKNLMSKFFEPMEASTSNLNSQLSDWRRKMDLLKNQLQQSEYVIKEKQRKCSKSVVQLTSLSNQLEVSIKNSNQLNGKRKEMDNSLSQILEKLAPSQN